MIDSDEPIHIDKEDARAGHTTGYMRYVLGFGLLLAVIAMSVVWIAPTLTS